MAASSPRRRARHAAWLATLLGALASAPAFASDVLDAEAIVRNAATQVFETVNADRAGFDADPARLERLIGDLVLPYFDFERMSQRVLGKDWRRASPAQRERFADEFEALLVRTYASAAREFSTRPVQFLPLRANAEGTLATVRTSIVADGGTTIPINYEMYESENGWKVYDVSIDGVSLVINYRTTFSREIRAGGIDQLIERLSRHNDGRQT